MSAKCQSSECICRSCPMSKQRNYSACSCIQYGITVMCNSKKKECNFIGRKKNDRERV